MNDEVGAASTGTVYRADDVTVDTGARELIVSGRTISLERRAFDLLAYLLANRERVVSKEELWNEVWQGRPVSDSVMPRAISKIRKALGDRDEPWIATVHGVGYRVAAPVEVVERPEARPTNTRYRGLILLALISVSAIGALNLTSGRDLAEPRGSVAVLPVQLEAGDDQLGWARYGLLPLMERALADEGAIAIDPGTILSTLNRNPEALSADDRAEVLRANSGADWVVLPRLTSREGRYQLTVSTIGEPGTVQISLNGADPTLVAVGAAQRLADKLSLSRTNPSIDRRQLLTEDPFVNEAYARGLDARLRSEWNEARDFFETVLAAAPDLHWARYQLSTVTRRLGDWERTRELNETLLEAARRTGDRELQGSVQNTAGTLAWRKGDVPAAQQWYEAARETFRDIGSDHSLAGAEGNLAILASIRGEFGQAEQLYERAAATYRSMGDEFTLSAVLKNMGVMNMDRGRLKEATESLEESLKIRQRLGLRREAALNLSALSEIEMRLGRWKEARSFQLGVLETAREIGARIMEAQALTDLAKLHRQDGKQVTARELASEALYIAQELGNPAGEVLATLELARANRELGDTERARVLAAEALDLYRELESPLGEISAGILLARIDLDDGRISESEQALDDIEPLVARFDHPQHRLDLARLRARALTAAGDARSSLEAWESALQIAREGDNLYQLMLTQSLACLSGLAPDEIVNALEAAVLPIPERFACLAEVRAGSGDADAARRFAEEWRQTAGDRWSPADQARYDRVLAIASSPRDP